MVGGGSGIRHDRIPPPHAEHAAETAEFAATHGNFWEMHDLLYENQEKSRRPVPFRVGGRGRPLTK
jgi:hypothetical protein